MRYILAGGLWLLPFLAAAQKAGTGSVQGTLVDSSQAKPLSGATITVLNPDDSLVVRSGVTGQEGTFHLQNIAFGTYILQVTFTGYGTVQKRFTLSSNSPVVQTGTLSIQPLPKLMEGIIVKTAPITVNGDTTDIRVSDFKTIPNATTEDLLKKLPGVEVEKDGTIKAQGEKVTRVLVDGKRFFGKDPKMATRNLPADMIERIQMIDSKSEQSEFSGFDDGERVQTINIITKKDKKNGVFGKGSLAAGTDDRVAGAVSFNSFKGERQLSVIAQSNNINNQQFTAQDFLGTMNTDNNNGRRQGSNAFSANSNGIGTTHAGGLNYNDLLGTKTKLNVSYFYDHINTLQNRNRFRETFFPGDSSLFNTNDTRTDNRNQNHRLNLEVEHQFDSFNSLLFRPELNFQQTNNFAQTHSFTTRGKTVSLNTVDNAIHTYTHGYDINNSLLFRHRFKKPGRTFSINLTQKLNANDWNRDNVAYTLRPSGRLDTLDQVSSNNRDGKTNAVNVSLTEPLGSRSQVELTYAYSNTANSADQETFRLDKTTGLYEVEVDNLTNQFRNTNVSHRTGINYRLQIAPNFNMSTGLAVQHAELESDNLSKATHLQQSFNNLFPNFNLTYRKSRKKSLRLTYRGITRQPSITQLQDVLDNSRVLHIRMGNPELKQEFVNNLVFRYNTFNASTLQQFSINVNGSIVSNNISNTNTINNTSDTMVVDGIKLGPGVQYSKYRNVDGAFDIGGSVNYSFPVTKSPGNFLHLGARVQFDREVNLINQQLSKTDNYLLSGSVKLTLNIDERFDLNLASNTQYNIARYSTYEIGRGNFWVQRFNAEPTFTTSNGWVLSNDFEYLLNRGQAAGFNQSVPLWNLSLSKLFLKNKQAELKLSVVDLLNKNTNVTRNIEQNYKEDIRTQVLKRYFLLGFTYNLNKFPGAGKAGRRKQAKAGR